VSARGVSRGRRVPGRERRAACAGALLLALALAGCRGPDFTERRHLGDPAMRLAPDPTEAHFHEKATAAREARGWSLDVGVDDVWRSDGLDQVLASAGLRLEF